MQSLPRRDPASHKGTHGTVTVVGACAAPDTRMVGAPALAAIAALRAGAGLARIAAPEPVLNAALAIAPSATGAALPAAPDGALIPHRCAEVLDQLLTTTTCLAIGPGLGSPDGADALVLRALAQEDAHVVADADAINALARTPAFEQDLRARAVLTPHPGEFRRLAAPLNIKADPTDPAQRPAAAEQLAQRLGAVVVLKGRHSVVTDGFRTWTCQRGHPCLATAGTGDVLTGVIAAIIAQFTPPGPAAIGNLQMPKPPERPLDLYDAARTAVQIHARAGEAWALSRQANSGLLALELADLLPPIIESLRS